MQYTKTLKYTVYIFKETYEYKSTPLRKFQENSLNFLKELLFPHNLTNSKKTHCTQRFNCISKFPH